MNNAQQNEFVLHQCLKAQNEYDELYATHENLKTSYRTLNAEYNEAQEQYLTAVREINALQAQLEVARLANDHLRAETNNLKAWQQAHRKEILMTE